MKKSVVVRKSRRIVREEPRIVLVIAGSYHEFDSYVRQHQGEAQYKWVSSLQDVCGFRYVQILKIGTWWRNPMSQHQTVLELERDGS